MKKKSYVVFGLGSFGYSVAETLADSGYEVMVVDKGSDPTQSISSKVTYAVKADVTDTGTLESLDISQFDVAVVAFTQDMNASIMATLYAKECRIPKVVAKAVTALHATILRKVGADEVVFPERDMGVRVAQNLVAGGMVDFLELSDEYRLTEIRVPSRWVGHSLNSLDVRGKYKLNVIAVKDGEEVSMNIDPNQRLEGHQFLVVMGDNESLDRLLGGEGGR
ncbi:MAG: TrkA family potassium uptake protein [Lachnospiraceae bacterium]|nr:TrkA family potassium uptake protein [Lachnospiraceae bacterium]